jgi:hypothetical protein
MSMEAITPNEAVALVNALNEASNGDDVERALAFFADDAVVTTPPTPPSGQTVWTGTQQVRALLQWQLDKHFHAAARNIQVTGNTVTWDSMVALDVFRRMGLDRVELAVEAVVQDRKITSFTATLSPESQRKVEAAMTPAGAPQFEAAA